MTQQQPFMPNQDVRKNVLHVGLPASKEGIDQYHKDGGKIFFFVTPEEKPKLTLEGQDCGVTWISDEAVKKFLFDHWPMWAGWQIVGNEGDLMKKLASIMFELVELANFDTRSITYLTKDNTPTKNALQNFRWVDDGIKLSRARGRGAGTVGVVIAAGPSLNAKWQDIKRFQQSNPERVCVIVAGRSYKKCMEEGIVPQFVYEVEQFEWDDKIWQFAPTPHPDTKLVFPLSVCPGVPRAWPAERICAIDHNTAAMFGWKIREDSIDGGNSVLHHMFNWALWLKCSPIILCGADLAYPNGFKEDTHANGTFHPWPSDILKGEKTHQEPMTVKAMDGGTVQSSLPYQNFRLFLEIQIERGRKELEGLKVYNTSERGQYIAGTTYIDSKELESLWKQPSTSPEPSSVPASSDTSASASSGVASS